jgi:hypothetical protein
VPQGLLQVGRRCEEGRIPSRLWPTATRLVEALANLAFYETSERPRSYGPLPAGPEGLLMRSPEVFLHRAAECERMAKFTHDSDSRVSWKRLAERWHRCAKVDISANSEAARHRGEPDRHRHPDPPWMHH